MLKAEFMEVRMEAENWLKGLSKPNEGDGSSDQEMLQ